MEGTRYITTQEASVLLHVTEQYVRQLVRNGKLKGEPFGKVWMIDRDDVIRRRSESGKYGSVDRPVTSVLKEDRGGYSNNSNNKRFKVLSFFSGAMGLDLGLERAGMDTVLACEFDKASQATIAGNKPDIGLIGDILNYSPEEIMLKAGMKLGDQVDVIAGGPPCQAFSTAGRRLGFEDARGNVFIKFLDIVLAIRPRYVVIENVRGILSSKLTIDLPDDELEVSESIKGIPGSALYYLLNKLSKGGYNISFNLYNSANFGTPQIRERVVIIGTLDSSPVPYLQATHAETPQDGLKPWRTFGEAVAGLSEVGMEYIKFSENRLRYLRLLGPGQNWRNLPPDLQPLAMGNSFFLGGGKTGFYRRLAWDRPAPTLVTHPAMPATDLGHPVKDRPLSIQEYKRVQEFPDDWIIAGKLADQYKQVGNAVPLSLGEAIGKVILNHSQGLTQTSPQRIRFSRYKDTDHRSWMRMFQSSIEQVSSLEPSLFA